MAHELKMKGVPTPEEIKAAGYEGRQLYQFKLNEGTHREPNGHDDVFEPVYGPKGEVIGQKKIDIRPREPKEYFKGETFWSPFELDKLFPSMISSEYPLAKFVRLDGTGADDMTEVQKEAFERGRRQALIELGMLNREEAEAGKPAPQDMQTPAVADPDSTLESMSMEDLRKMAAEEEVELGGAKTKKEIVARIQAAVGVTA